MTGPQACAQNLYIQGLTFFSSCFSEIVIVILSVHVAEPSMVLA